LRLLTKIVFLATKKSSGIAILGYDAGKRVNNYPKNEELSG
jgi:hypothetical protein